MGLEDPVLVAKIAGALVAFGLGIWIGLGTPGLKRTSGAREWRSADRLRATWINRLFFRMDQPVRRFDTDRLIVPKHGSEEEGREAEEDERERPDVVRLRRL